MKSESREKDIVDIDEMIDRNFTFYIVDASREYVEAMPKIMER